MQLSDKKIWFPAKTYGWGWGPPCCWQGWLVLGIWIVVLLAGIFALRPYFEKHQLFFFVYVGVFSLLLITICWFKGERPRWRWGKD